MRAIVAHAAKDLRLDEVAEQPLGRKDVRIRIETGGICGSDLHYYNHGGTGFIRLREPMILGHEVAGSVIEVGAEVGTLAVGARVAIDPSRSCGTCRYCQEGLHNHCLDMRFMGSAMRMPHIQGAFCETLVVPATQAVPLAATTTMAEAAMAEPLAVCLHAVKRAGSLLGKRVLVTGCGPIGTLVAMAARVAGASHVVASDVQQFVLDLTRRVAADETVNVVEDPEGLMRLVKASRPFDVHFEASGNGAALKAGLELVRPRGIIVQLGLGIEASLPMNFVVTREIALIGSFRFHEEFAEAVGLIGRRRIDVAPLLTATLPLTRARDAFELAGDRSRSVKVQLAFV